MRWIMFLILALMLYAAAGPITAFGDGSDPMPTCRGTHCMGQSGK